MTTNNYQRFICIAHIYRHSICIAHNYHHSIFIAHNYRYSMIYTCHPSSRPGMMSQLSNAAETATSICLPHSSPT